MITATWNLFSLLKNEGLSFHFEAYVFGELILASEVVVRLKSTLAVFDLTKNLARVCVQVFQKLKYHAGELQDSPPALTTFSHNSSSEWTSRPLEYRIPFSYCVPRLKYCEIIEFTQPELLAG